jgi:hypothetical protein
MSRGENPSSFRVHAQVRQPRKRCRVGVQHAGPVSPRSILPGSNRCHPGCGRRRSQPDYHNPSCKYFSSFFCLALAFMLARSHPSNLLNVSLSIEHLRMRFLRTRPREQLQPRFHHLTNRAIRPRQQVIRRDFLRLFRQLFFQTAPPRHAKFRVDMY